MFKQTLLVQPRVGKEACLAGTMLSCRSSFKGKQEIHIPTDIITPAITIITIAVTQETSLSTQEWILGSRLSARP